MSRLNYVAASPDGMKALGGVYNYVEQSGLPKTLIELAYLRTSLINGCAYCIDMHTSALTKAGVAANKISLVTV